MHSPREGEGKKKKSYIVVCCCWFVIAWLVVIRENESVDDFFFPGGNCGEHHPIEILPTAPGDDRTEEDAEQTERR